MNCTICCQAKKKVPNIQPFKILIVTPVIPFTLVGNKIVYKQLSSAHLIGYLLSHIFDERSWNNCYILHVLAGIMYGAALVYFKEK